MLCAWPAAPDIMGGGVIPPKEATMRALHLSLYLLAVLATAWAAGCLPPRGAVSPDGQTFYFPLPPDAKVSSCDQAHQTNIYALDIKTGRIRALTDGPGEKGWCWASSDGKLVTYMIFPAGLLATTPGQQGHDAVSIPITGMLDGYMPAWPIPGDDDGSDKLRLLALKPVPTEDDKHGGQWVLRLQDKEVPLEIAPSETSGAGEVAVSREWCAVTVVRVTGEAGAGDAAKPAVKALIVYMIRLPADAEPPVVIEAAKWEQVGDTPQVADLALSADGRRLVAAVVGAGEKGSTRFFELAAGKPPKALFDAPLAHAPRWTPDASGIVYLAQDPAGEEWTDVMLRPLAAKGPVLLARLPGAYSRAYTTWFWTENEKLRIYHLSDEGVRLIETSADGKAATGRLLTHDRLRVQQGLADLGRWLDKTPSPEFGAGWPAALADKTKAIQAAADKGVRDTAAAMEPIWKEAAVWEAVPATPPAGELPKRGPAVQPAGP
jgi:hypothetical protein